MEKHIWLTLSSKRQQPYTLDDISIIIPSTANRFNKRLEWFWPQYVANTEEQTIKNTIIPCDEEEIDYLERLTDKKAKLVPTSPRWIVNKTLSALEEITTRLTFRLANDIMIVRKGWEEVLIKQFNAEEGLQVIAEIQHGTAFPVATESLRRDWGFIRRKYSEPATAAVYPHGSRIFAQTAVWRAYYTQVLRYTTHDHDELYFSQLATGDGVVFTHFGGINAYIPHKGITNKDFTKEDIKTIEREREGYENLGDTTGFRRLE